MELDFDPIADAAYFAISDADVESTRELWLGIIVDDDSTGHLVGVGALSMSQRS